IGTMMFSQIYRYRYIYSATQRQQVRWFLLGAAVAPLVATLLMLARALIPALQQPGPASVLFKMAARTIFVVSMLLVPLAVAISLLRYRLFEIDLLIRRTLLYSVITAAAFVIYLLAVGGTSMILQSRNDLLAGLLAVGLVAVGFVPARRRLQVLMD